MKVAEDRGPPLDTLLMLPPLLGRLPLIRRVELTENTQRHDLNDYETSARRLAELRQEEALQRAKAEKGLISGAQRPEKKPRSHRATGGKKTGRPKGKKAGSRRAVAEATGEAPATQRRLEQHVALAEKYPFLQRPNWTRLRLPIDLAYRNGPNHRETNSAFGYAPRSRRQAHRDLNPPSLFFSPAGASRRPLHPSASPADLAGETRHEPDRAAPRARPAEN